MLTSSDRRLQDMLGDEPGLDQTTHAWSEGFGIVSPDVARYVEVLRELPDAIELAMNTIAGREELELLDAGTITLLSLLARAQRPARVLEVGTGIGHVTLHLARAVGAQCTLTSIDPNPLRQEQAHAFLERDEHNCAVELRLGDPLRLLKRESNVKRPWDMVVLTDPALARLDVLDVITPQLASNGLLVIPWALRGGRVADAQHAWSGEDAEAEEQRTLNRRVATEPRFVDTVLLPIGDGLLLARGR